MEKTNSDGRSIEKEFFIKATLQRVFQALTEQVELERWFLVKAELDLRPGGAISFEWDRAKGDLVINAQANLRETLRPAQSPMLRASPKDKRASYAKTGG